MAEDGSVFEGGIPGRRSGPDAAQNRGEDERLGAHVPVGDLDGDAASVTQPDGIHRLRTVFGDEALVGGGLPDERGDAPAGAAGKTVLVTAHGNSLRALVKHLDGISDSAIAELNIPTGQPLVYDIGTDFMPTGPGTYLDPEAAAAAAAAVANQGR